MESNRAGGREVGGWEPQRKMTRTERQGGTRKKKASAQYITIMLWIVGKFLLKLINNSSRENKENHNCDRGLDMCS